MAKTKRNIGQEILDDIQALKRGEHGRITTVPSVATVRAQTGLSPPLKFATLLVSRCARCMGVGSGRRAPSGAARTLLIVVAKNPRALIDVA